MLNGLTALAPEEFRDPDLVVIELYLGGRFGEAVRFWPLKTSRGQKRGKREAGEAREAIYIQQERLRTRSCGIRRMLRVYAMDHLMPGYRKLASSSKCRANRSTSTNSYIATRL